MRILLVHNRYQEGGGEDVVFEAEAGLLERRGHSVTRLVFDNASISDQRALLTTAHLAASTVWSRSASQRVRHATRDARAEVVHFHNTFPLVSPAAYSAAKAEGAAVVQTLHNYRLLCPSAVFFRAGHVCEDCLGRTPPWPSVVHGCYRGSRPQTAAVATMLTVHRLRRTWSRDVDLFIALTEFARQKFIAGGLSAERVVVKPNFVAPDPGAKTEMGDFFLFVGRLTEEKGIPLLIRAWTEYDALPPLRIVGDGPLAPLVERISAERPNIEFLGRVPGPRYWTRCVPPGPSFFRLSGTKASPSRSSSPSPAASPSSLRGSARWPRSSKTEPQGSSSSQESRRTWRNKSSGHGPNQRHSALWAMPVARCSSATSPRTERMIS